MGSKAFYIKLRVYVIASSSFSVIACEGVLFAVCGILCVRIWVTNVANGTIAPTHDHSLPQTKSLIHVYTGTRVLFSVRFALDIFHRSIFEFPFTNG